MLSYCRGLVLTLSQVSPMHYALCSICVCPFLPHVSCLSPAPLSPVPCTHVSCLLSPPPHTYIPLYLFTSSPHDIRHTTQHRVGVSCRGLRHHAHILHSLCAAGSLCGGSKSRVLCPEYDRLVTGTAVGPTSHSHTHSHIHTRTHTHTLAHSYSLTHPPNPPNLSPLSYHIPHTTYHT
jgi:hypothetical protein